MNLHLYLLCVKPFYTSSLTQCANSSDNLITTILALHTLLGSYSEKNAAYAQLPIDGKPGMRCPTVGNLSCPELNVSHGGLIDLSNRRLRK